MISTLLDPRFKVKFFDAATTQFAIDRLIQQAYESDSEVLPMEQGHEPIQPDNDNQEDMSKTSGQCNSQLNQIHSVYYYFYGT